jgi:pSer/pThr/pTyr-binding forkhead associated (FHA) protein
MLVEALDEHGNVHQRQRFRGAGSTCRIGRSLACEITLDDAFAAPEHARLTLQPGGLVRVEDLGTRNGTRMEGRRIGSGGVVISGGELHIGRTRVRVRTTGATCCNGTRP